MDRKDGNHGLALHQALATNFANHGDPGHEEANPLSLHEESKPGLAVLEEDMNSTLAGLIRSQDRCRFSFDPIPAMQRASNNFKLP